MTIDTGLSNLISQLQIERKSVDVANHDFSVRELVRMLSDGELNIAPEYQRKYRWKPDVASTFIESILLGLPVPAIFVATNDDFRWEVVDGLQRLSSLVYFVGQTQDQLSIVKRSTPLKLEGLTKLTQLNGKAFADLPPEIQIYFNRQPLQVTSLTDKSSKEVRFNLFERLNAGAIALTQQEVRACIYRGEFNDFIETLSSNPKFNQLLKLQESNQHDGTAVEQVLKFFAYKNARATYDGRVKSWLNKYMADSSKGFNIGVERVHFELAVDFLHAATEGGPFLRQTTKVTPLVEFEACLAAAGEIISQGVEPVAPTGNWIEDPELVDSSTGGSNTKSMLNRRITRARELFSASA